MTIDATPDLEGLGKYKFGWSDSDVAGATARRGLNEDVVRNISTLKNEPDWMLALRLKGLKLFGKKPMPTWGADLSGIDFDNIKYFVRSTEKQADSWDDLPADIKNTYDRLGIPEAEKARLIAGVAAQYECCHPSTRVYTANRGVVPIKEIETGDRVFSFDEAQSRMVVAPVRAAVATGVRQTYAVRTRRGVVRATDNHPFLVLADVRAAGDTTAQYVRCWKTLGELKVGDLVAVQRDVPEFGEPLLIPSIVRRPKALPIEPKWSNPQLLWLLGYFIGDGSLQSAGRTHRVQFAAPERDDQLRIEIARVVAEEFGLDAKVPDADRVVVNSIALVDWFHWVQLGGNAYSKRVPQWVFSLPLDQRLAFLAGYVDADGYIAPGGAVRVTSVNAAMLNDIADLAELCGLRASAPHPIASKHPFDAERTMHAFRMTLSGPCDRLPLRNFRRIQQFTHRWHRGQSFVAARGREFRRHCTEHLGFTPVQSIDIDDLTEVWDVEVDGPHNFVAEGLVVHNSEVVYHKIREDLEELGVLFLDTDTALREHEDLVREYFTSVIPVGDNKFASLNTAVWSGGSFIYVPKGVKVDIPLQAYFRINTENMGQFERTLIIADEGSSVHYVEGCTAPVYSSDSLHSAVVEIIVKKNAHVRYTTIQNWSNNVYNLVTKRTAVEAGGRMEWIDGNIGCLASNQTVTTRSGLKFIQDVVTGEEVLAYDDQSGELVFRRVVAKRYSGEQPVREVRVGERRLRVTDNHPFYSYTYDPDQPKKTGRYRLAYVRADHLTEAIVPITSLDYGEPHKLEFPALTTTFTTKNQYAAELESTRTNASRLRMPVATTEDLMWFFGAFLGDGSVDTKRGINGGRRWAKVTMSVPKTDRARERLDELMEIFAPDIPPKDRADGVTVTWSSVELADFLELNGFMTGSLRKRVPEWVLNLPEQQRLAFVAGYLDTDGCAVMTRRGLQIKSVNRPLLQDVARILVSLGINPRLHTEFDEERTVVAVGNEVTARGAHRLDFPADPRLLWHVCRTLQAAADQQIPSTQARFRKVGRSAIELPESVEIRKVEVSEHLETVPTWDIEVEGTGNFVSEGFIVHNSKVTMKYPACYLLGEHAYGETLSVAFAGEGQHQDAGAKMVHAAPHTSSQIISKSVARSGGRTSYRGLVQIQEGAVGSKSSVRCDALLTDAVSRSDTYPYVDVREDDASIGHEATVSKVGEDQLFYLMQRGMTENEAMAMIVRGFVEPIARELPMEYALELNRLIELQMEGSVG